MLIGESPIWGYPIPEVCVKRFLIVISFLAGTVVQVVQKGYKLGDLVIRPARVVVSAGAPGEDA